MRQSKSKPIYIILIAALAILLIFATVIYALGFRYIKSDDAKFIGWTKKNTPFSGSIKYSDGAKGKLSINEKTGTPTITYSTGDIYEGDVLGINRHGNGKITYANGDVYNGDFENNKRTGQAEITYSDGSTYEGAVLDGTPNGLGKYTFADSSWYYGEFKAGAKDGIGEYHSADGSYYYGTFKNDLKHGSDIVTVNLFDGGIYTGKCKMYFGESASTYVGTFIEDKRTGEGTYTFSSGERYVGSFKNGLFDGMGTYKFSNGDEYTGEFKNGEIVEKPKADSEKTEEQTENE